MGQGILEHQVAGSHEVANDRFIRGMPPHER